MLIPSCPFCGFTLRELTSWQLAREMAGFPGRGPAVALVADVGPDAAVLMCDVCGVWACVA